MSQIRIKNNLHAGNQRGVTAYDKDVRFKITIEHLWTGETRVTAPFNNYKLCEAMLNDAFNVVKEFKPKSDEEAKAEGLVLQPEKKIIVAQ